MDQRWQTFVPPTPAVEALEPRQLLAWGDFPRLIGLDTAAQRFPKTTGRGQAIALIDTGVDFNHPAMAGKIWTNPGEVPGNGKDDDQSGYADDVNGWDFFRDDNRPEDENGHGTALTSIMNAKKFRFAGKVNRGVAPLAKVIPLKVADPTGRIADIGFARRIEKALQWVERNHDRYNIVAVNMSLRVRETADYDATFRDEIRRLGKAGVFLVATGHRAPMGGTVSKYPAADPAVFNTGIIKADDTVSTQRPPDAGHDLLAPGKDVPIAMLGRGTFAASSEATSWAAPFVTATAALVRQIFPNSTNRQVAAILRDSADRITDPGDGQTYMRLRVDKALALARQRVKKRAPAPARQGPAAGHATTEATPPRQRGEAPARAGAAAISLFSSQPLTDQAVFED